MVLVPSADLIPVAVSQLTSQISRCQTVQLVGDASDDGIDDRRNYWTLFVLFAYVLQNQR